MFHTSKTTATTFPEDRNGLGTHTAWYDSSIAAYGYTYHFDAARTYWNYNSSKVHISKNTGSHKKYQDRYYVANSEVKDLIGLAAYYQYTWFSSENVGSNDYWDYCEIVIYENNMRASSNYSSNAVKMNIAHEIGHTLKMGHAPMYYGANYYDSVMNKGFYPIYSSTTDYDRQELYFKWGY
ncbi:zinc metalloprotease [Lottiidibacillus patelloidae]|nr:hypothetical protein [Lottiidibacillus patelloidae]